EALKDFRTVIEKYPDSRKTPDALLKIGYCNYELKNWGEARNALNQVVKQYADTTAGRLASQRLVKEEAEGDRGSPLTVPACARSTLPHSRRRQGSSSPRSSSPSRARPIASGGRRYSSGSPAARCAASTATPNTPSTAANGSRCRRCWSASSPWARSTSV